MTTANGVDIWQDLRVFNKIDKQKLRHTRKGSTQSGILVNGTRIDEYNQNSTTKIFCVNFSQLPKFMLDRILQNWAWNFNHKNFNVLAQNRCWNFTKTVSQIYFQDHCRITVFPESEFLHSVHISFFIFFCILNFDVLLFFNFSQHIKLIKSKISEFFTHKINFWERFQPTQ